MGRLARSVLIIALYAALNGLLWLDANQPMNPEESHYPFEGLSYNHYQRDQSPFDPERPSREQMAKDLQILARRTRSIRIYSSASETQQIPELARASKLKVIASAYLNHDPEHNAREVEAAIRLAGRNQNVTRLIIGNETQLTQTVPEAELIEYLQKARRRLRTPVSSAEPWDFWIQHPEFANHVDFIAIHILPYWREVPIEEAVEYVFSKYEAVRRTFPGKVVVIAETGWPSSGPQKGGAEPSTANQAYFVREFISRAHAEGVSYNIVEAFDQPWKSAIEGRVGEHWGVMNADREEKFPVSGPVLEDPNWSAWALSSTAMAGLASILLLFRKGRLGLGGQIVWVGVVQAACLVAVLLAREATDEYISPGDIAFWTTMITAQLLLAIIFLTDASEIVDVIGRKPLRRAFPPHPEIPESDYPFVSIHLACCKEPPAMVIATINSLAELDYPNFEVVVVDNNTPDPRLWWPVQRRCKELGARFRFVSLRNCQGFKAGALNYALAITDPKAQAVGVVDADYVVEPNWLKATVPYFLRAAVAVVQAPQEHRDWHASLFQRMENDEYSGFFRIGMVQRNEDNAIIQHGTMTLIRRSMLDELGGWAEWCICEDAELGLRLLLKGSESVYIDQAFGRGLVPDSFEAYSKQRFRWAYGAMRIMRRYWREMLGLRPGLSVSQRYQFVKGWLPWLGDALHLGFSIAAIVWSTILLLDPLQTEFPEPIFMYPALGLVGLRLFGFGWTYAARVQIGLPRTILAMTAGGSLTHTIAKAVLQGLVTSGKPFHRTPKMDKAPALIRSLVVAREEFVLGCGLLCFAVGILLEFGTVNDTAVLWAVTLATQSIPYWATIVTAVISSFGGSEAVKAPPITHRDPPIDDNIKAAA